MSNFLGDFFNSQLQQAQDLADSLPCRVAHLDGQFATANDLSAAFRNGDITVEQWAEMRETLASCQVIE